MTGDEGKTGDGRDGRFLERKLRKELYSDKVRLKPFADESDQKPRVFTSLNPHEGNR